MSNEHWPEFADYDKSDMKIYEDRIFIVNDPWLAQDRGFFYTREDAELFIKAVKKKWKKEGKPHD